MAIDTYYLKTRLFPTVLTALPAIIFFNKFVVTFYHDKLGNIFSLLPTITDVILSSAIVFFLVQINRFISKEIFQRLYFNDELRMPSTNMMLKSDDQLEISIKQKIQEKIKAKFDIDLLSALEESSDEIRARKLITASVSQIKNSLRDNKMLFQHNIEYGFFRNLIGGSTIALMISLIVIINGHYNHDVSVRNLGVILSITYALPILFSKIIINRYGNYYAKILYSQFLTL